MAGVGNIFLGDDGFGVEVVRQLAGRALPDGVEVVDFGIRGVHLAYELLDGCDAAHPGRRGRPGRAARHGRVIEAGRRPTRRVRQAAGRRSIAHGLAPDDVLALLGSSARRRRARWSWRASRPTSPSGST